MFLYIYLCICVCRLYLSPCVCILKYIYFKKNTKSSIDLSGPARGPERPRSPQPEQLRCLFFAFLPQLPPTHTRLLSSAENKEFPAFSKGCVCVCARALKQTGVSWGLTKGEWGYLFFISFSAGLHFSHCPNSKTVSLPPSPAPTPQSSQRQNTAK